MKAYKFIANYKKDKKDPWKPFEKYLWLNPEEKILASENILKFLVQQMRKGSLPEGIYDELHLYEWKFKVKKESYRARRKKLAKQRDKLKDKK